MRPGAILIDGAQNEHDILNIAGQLADHGLIHWRANPRYTAGSAVAWGHNGSRESMPSRGRAPAPVEIRFSARSQSPGAGVRRRRHGLITPGRASRSQSSGWPRVHRRLRKSALQPAGRTLLLRASSETPAFAYHAPRG